MTGEIRIAFNTDKGEVLVAAAMENQDQKNFTVGILLSAIKLVMSYQKSAIIKPAAVQVPAGNGKPPFPMKLSN